MLQAADISAIIITRGDVDLQPILDTLPYDDVVVRTSSDVGCFGRYLSIADAKHDTIYFQDDDILFTRHEELIRAHNFQVGHEGAFTSNMPSPWWEEQYERFDMALVGAGSIVPRDLPWAAFGRYLAVHPRDESFYRYCDMIHGVLTPYHRVDLGYEILPQAHWPDRIHTRPGAAAEKQSIIDRALALR